MTPILRAAPALPTAGRSDSCLTVPAYHASRDGEWEREREREIIPIRTMDMTGVTVG